MYFKHIYERGLAQASYIVGCQSKGVAMVIDPRRDIDVYLDIAEKENLTITHVTETHIHADFLSGARELAEVTGAKLLLSDEGGPDWQYQFDHEGLRDGDTFNVGNLKIDVMHTPGHTPEHISFLLTDTPAGNYPVMVFTGDFVFVGDIGRPDLLEKAAGIKNTQEAGAKALFKSLEKFKKLPDHVQVWPAHGAGSACGKALGAVPSSTVGYEKLVNWGLQIEDEEKFVEAILEGQPEPPVYFAMMKKLNKTGPEIFGGLPHPARFTLTQFRKALHDNIRIIDTRDKLSFAGGHVRGAVNIQDNSAFSTWAGWILNYDEPFVLIASPHRIEELTRALIRIGLDNMAGYFTDVDSWANQCHELETTEQMTVKDLIGKRAVEDIAVVDVRGYSEYNAGHIPGAMNLHAGYLLRNLDKIPTDSKVVVHCESGDRSSIAASLLQSQGFDNIINLTGGIAAWRQEGQPVDKQSEKNTIAA